MILKVQLSLASTDDQRQALIYDEEETFMAEEPLANFAGLKEAMGDRVRAFFEADLNERLDPECRRLHEVTVVHRRDCTCGVEIVFGKLLPEQGW